RASDPDRGPGDWNAHVGATAAGLPERRLRALRHRRDLAGLPAGARGRAHLVRQRRGHAAPLLLRRVVGPPARERDRRGRPGRAPWVGTRARLDTRAGSVWMSGRNFMPTGASTARSPVASTS